ncbi:Na+/melibiose symporter [Caldanaerobius fijiensis DSM 17918]|uniref:Na+/melibiose symporter n=2 Tax=Caldanaerobius TaxID=862261 RepID=A0A1M4T3L3_9THEO|nr:Na+/melibiose symporter [Caldanaerobius fijiensis DSM 17918]
MKLVIGNLGVSMGVNMLATYMVPLLHFHTGNTVFSGFVLSMGLLSGAVIQPFFGILSDSTFSVWGRRKPYVFIFGIMCFIFTYFFSSVTKIQSMLLFVFLFYISFHAYQIPLNSMIPDNVINSEKGSMSGYWNLFGGMGALAVPILGGLFWDYDKGLVFKMVGLTIAITSLVSVLFVEERKQIKGNFSFELFKRYFYRRDVWSFYIAKSIWWMALAAEVPYFTIYYSQYMALGMGVSSFLVTVFMLFDIISSPFLGKLADRYNRKYLMITFLLCFAVLNLFLPKTTNFLLLMILMGLLGICYASLFVFPFSLLMDMTQRGHEGFYLGMDNVFMYLPKGISTLISGHMIAKYGYWIIFVNASVLALCAALAILLLWKD